MEVYRIAKKEYLNDLSGTGAKINGGRWNREGLYMLYTSEHLSLAVLEILANQFRKKIDSRFGFLKLELPNDNIMEYSDIEELKEGWRVSQYNEQTIGLGTNWLLSQKSLALRVPSAVLEQENNILINPYHADFDKIVIQESSEVNLDGRVNTTK